jgi:hypothetical protein
MAPSVSSHPATIRGSRSQSLRSGRVLGSRVDRSGGDGDTGGGKRVEGWGLSRRITPSFASPGRAPGRSVGAIMPRPERSRVFRTLSADRERVRRSTPCAEK